MIDYDYLDEQYGEMPTRVSVPRGERKSAAVGSLTDHLRSVKPNRDGAHKRAAKLLKERQYWGA